MAFSLQLFFYEGSEAEIFIERSRNPKECFGKISDLGLQYFQRYDLWRLGFLQAPEFHIKYVTSGISS